MTTWFLLLVWVVLGAVVALLFGLLASKQRMKKR